MDISHVAIHTTIGFMSGCLFMLFLLLAVKSIVHKEQPTPPPLPSLEDLMEPVHLTEEEQKARTEELRKIAGKINRNRTMWDLSLIHI